MSLAEIKTAAKELSPKELTELAAFIREQDNLAWDQEIDANFSEGGRLRPVLEEVGKAIDAGDLTALPEVSRRRC